MSVNWYYLLLWLIQFDDMTTRDGRRVNDKLAAARSFFENFNENCVRMLIPTEFLAIDETLYPYRGGTVIKQYNPNKPAKYGILYCSISYSKFPYTYYSHAYAAKPTEITAESRYINSTDDYTTYLVDGLSLF